MTSDTLARARWTRQAPRGCMLRADYYLVARTQDGGEVLAVIHEMAPQSYKWFLMDETTRGFKESPYAAQRAVRKALREATDVRNK